MATSNGKNNGELDSVRRNTAPRRPSHFRASVSLTKVRHGLVEDKKGSQEVRFRWAAYALES